MFQRESRGDHRGAKALGWASVGIGLTELVVPQQIEHVLGLDDHHRTRGILRVLGIRELMHGLGILTERHPERTAAAGLWSRVAGDALDSALLGLAATRTRRPASFATVAAIVAGIGLLDVLYATRSRKY